MIFDKKIISAIDTAINNCGGVRKLARIMGGKNDSAIICTYRQRIKDGQHVEAGEEVWSRFWKALGPFLPPEYAPRGLRTGLVVPAVAASRVCKLYGLAQCATTGLNWGDHPPDNDHALPTVEVPPELNRLKRVAAFRAVDTSMAPRINEGDILYIDPDAEVKPGNVALVKYDSCVVCKRWRPAANGETVILASDNPEAEPIVVQAREIEWRYKVVMRITREMM